MNIKKYRLYKTELFGNFKNSSRGAFTFFGTNINSNNDHIMAIYFYNEWDISDVELLILKNYYEH